MGVRRSGVCDCEQRLECCRLRSGKATRATQSGTSSVSPLVFTFVFLSFSIALALLDGASIIALAFRKTETSRLAAQVKLHALVCVDLLIRRLAIVYNVEGSLDALLQKLSRVNKNSPGKACEQVLRRDAI